jgi:hypothetical protein
MSGTKALVTYCRPPPPSPLCSLIYITCRPGQLPLSQRHRLPFATTVVLSDLLHFGQSHELLPVSACIYVPEGVYVPPFLRQAERSGFLWILQEDGRKVA